MTPVTDFVIESFANDNDMLYGELPKLLRKKGYWEFKKAAIFLTVKEYQHFHECCIWCQENYPNDYFRWNDSIFFTNKKIATLMKLSVI